MNEFLDAAQLGALQRMKECPHNVFICWWKMGTGKTRLALFAFLQSGFNVSLVVTRRVAFSSWIDEIQKCNLPIRVFDDKNNLLYYPKGGSTHAFILLSADSLKNRSINYISRVCLIVDELYMFANPKSKRSLELAKFSCACPVRIGLSGTIMPARDNFAIWGQLKALGIHKALARNATEFRNTYQDVFKTEFGSISKNKKGSKEAIMEKVSPFIDVHYPEARPTRTQIITIKPSPLQRKAIKQLRELYEYNGVEYEHAPAVAHAINGISGGWHQEEILASPKLDRLLSLVEEISAEGEKVVIWCAYHKDIERIRFANAFPFVEFSGACQWSNEDFNVVVATEAMGASVNYFKDIKYAIYYSINYKSLDLDQSMGRHERKSSSHNGAHYYFLQTSGTLDKRIYSLVSESKRTEQEVIKTLSLAVDNLQEL